MAREKQVENKMKKIRINVLRGGDISDIIQYHKYSIQVKCCIQVKGVCNE